MFFFKPFSKLLFLSCLLQSLVRGETAPLPVAVDEDQITGKAGPSHVSDPKIARLTRGDDKNERSRSVAGPVEVPEGFIQQIFRPSEILTRSDH